MKRVLVLDKGKKNKKLLIVTTSTKTFNYILKDQTSFLNKYFTVYVGSNNSDLIEEYSIKQRVKFFVVPMHRKINIFADIKSIIFFLLIIRKLKPNIIHSYTPKAGLVCAISGYICRVPIRIHTFTGLIFPYKGGLLKIILALIDSLICRLNTNIVAEGKGVKELLYDNKIINGKVKIIGNGNIAGVDTKFYNPEKFKQNEKILRLREKLNIDQKSITFIFAGRINKEKGIIELLKAFNKTHNNINLIILGSFESNRFELKVKNMINNSKNKIQLVDWKNDIRPYLFISDCFILPSYREGFPNVLLQAGAMKLPSIVTDVPGSNEIIINSYNGWICKSKSSAELDKLINKVVSMPKSKFVKIGNRARKNVKKKYERSVYQKALVDFYNSL